MKQAVQLELPALGLPLQTRGCFDRLCFRKKFLGQQTDFSAQISLVEEAKSRKL